MEIKNQAPFNMKSESWRKPHNFLSRIYAKTPIVTGRKVGKAAGS
jgi:hypothetical protein